MYKTFKKKTDGKNFMTCIWIFIAFLVIIPNWKQLINKFCYTYIMEYCLTIKRNRLLVNQQFGESQNNFAEWKNPEKKGTSCMIPYIKNFRKCKLICSDRTQISRCLGIGRGEGGAVGMDYRGKWGRVCWICYLFW